jgi:DNA-binding transcriptional regulator GbsR (MarR family)
METKEQSAVREVETRLVEVAGRTTQDLGLGRIVGLVLGCVYLTEKESSLDEISSRLGLSKAAVSIAARQLDSLGLIQRLWLKGDRKHYYRTVDHFGVALQQGLLALVRGKLQSIGAELDRAEDMLDEAALREDQRTQFLRKRLARARNIRKKTALILENPIVKLLGGKAGRKRKK